MAKEHDYTGFDVVDEPEEVVEEEVVEETSAPKGPVFERDEDGRIVDTNK